MCNASNHSPSCTCGFGGDGHKGRNYAGNGVLSFSNSSTNYRHNFDNFGFDRQYHAFVGGFVNPNATCPVCGELVFFYQSENGGRVFFDELGPPWTKHPCTDNSKDSFKKTKNDFFNIYNINTVTKTTSTATTFLSKQIFYTSSLDSNSWYSGGWRPFSISSVSVIYGNFTKIEGIFENVKLELYVKNFDIDADKIKKLPVHLKKLDAFRFELSTFDFNFEEIRRIIFLKLKMADSESINTSDKYLFQLNPNKRQKIFLTQKLFSIPEYLINLIKNDSNKPCTYHEIALFLLKNKNSWNGYNADVLTDIIFNYVGSGKITYDFHDKCYLTNDGVFSFPIQELNRIESLDFNKVKLWKKSLNLQESKSKNNKYTRKYIAAFSILKLREDFFVEVELEKLDI
jgi:hypothetical protein